MIKFHRPWKVTRPLLTLSIIANLLFSRGLAQRGITVYEPPPVHSNQGFPGFFDTNTVRTGYFSFDLPSTAIEYGVNERFSLGANAATIAANILGLYGGLFKLRYVNASFSRFVSASTAHIGYSVSGDASLSLSVLMGSLNNSYFFDEKQSVGLNLLLARINVTSSQIGSVDYEEVENSSAFLSARYRWQASQSIALEGLLGTGILSSNLDSAQGSISISDFGPFLFNTGDLLGRAMVDFLVNENFQVSPQFYLILSDQRAVVSPMINVAFLVE